MRVRIVLFFIFVSISCFGQDRWFKHIDGWTSRQSFVRNDTIFSFGMDEINSWQIISVINGSDLSGKSLFSLKLNFDTIEKNPQRITTLANYRTVFKDGNTFIIGINLRDGGKKSSCYLNINNLSSNKLTDITFDTFSTYLDEIIKIGTSYYIAGDYRFIETQVAELPLSFIMKLNANSKKFIKAYKSQQGTSGYIWSYEDLLVNHKKYGTYFAHLRYKWDFKGGQWEDYIIKMDTLGNEFWKCQPNIRDSVSPSGLQIVQKPNGNLLVSWNDYWFRPYKNQTGNLFADRNDHCSLWFAEIDSAGKVLWRKQIKHFISDKIGRDSVHNLFNSKALATSSGVLWTGNYSWKYDHSYLLKTDYDGNPIWYREYELYPTNSVEQSFTPYDVTAAPDGGYVLTGEYVSDKGNIFPNGCQLATIVKVDSFGCLLPGCQKADSVPTAINRLPKKGFKLYPNPNNGSFTIEIENPAKDVSIEIFNLLGKLVKTVETNSSKSIYEIELNSIDGIYLVRVKNGDSVWNQKVSVFNSN